MSDESLSVNSEEVSKERRRKIFQKYSLLNKYFFDENVFSELFPEAFGGLDVKPVFSEGVTSLSRHIFDITENSSASVNEQAFDLLESFGPSINQLKAVEDNPEEKKKLLLDKKTVEDIRMLDFLTDNWQVLQYWRSFPEEDQALLLRSVKERTLPKAFYSNAEMQRLRPRPGEKNVMPSARYQFSEIYSTKSKHVPLEEAFRQINEMYGEDI